MKVGIDVSKLHKLNEGRGIGFYTKYLVEALEKYTDVEVKVLEDDGGRSGLDLVHYPFFDLFNHTLNITRDVPQIVTIHDVTPLVFSKQYPPGIKGRLSFSKQRSELKKVKAVITDSEASKKDIANFLNVDNSLIFPVYLAPAEHFVKIGDKKKLEDLSKKYNLPGKFLLYVGDVNYNKNIINVIRASGQAGIPLVICGKQAIDIEILKSKRFIKGPRDILRLITGKSHPEIAHFKDVLEAIEEHGNVSRLGFVSDEDLVGIYNLSSALIMPSFYEGFGLPVLEAQACGVPVITSNVSSLPEVVGGSAILVDPGNVEEIKKAIKQVLEVGIRNELVKKGFENVKRFSWEKVARETVEVYERVLNHE